MILDELNLDQRLEELLNQLMTGNDSDGRPAKNPGFMVFASQNPAFFAGCKSLSPALKNRFHYVHMDPWTDRDFAAVAESTGMPRVEADQFVHTFRARQKEHPPGTINTRTFFKELKRVTVLEKQPDGLLDVETPGVIKSVTGRPQPAHGFFQAKAGKYTGPAERHELPPPLRREK